VRQSWDETSKYRGPELRMRDNSSHTSEIFIHIRGGNELVVSKVA
jgi:hypothetical protein